MPSTQNHTFKTRQQGNKTEIWDSLRKSWIQLSPEEWVRQHFIYHIVNIKKYPTTLIAIEKEIKLYELHKRFDIVIYDKNTQPWMIVECKNEKEILNDNTIQQALRYNLTVKAPYVVITNGIQTMTFHHTAEKLQRMAELPDFPIS